MGFKGSVNTEQTCPVCNQRFKRQSLERGFHCPQHLTFPSRFYISAKSFGIPSKIYSDRLGNVFDSYQAAINQWTAMNTAYQESLRPRGREFDPNDWIPAKVKEQLFQVKAAEYLANKAKLFNRGKLSKSRWRAINDIFSKFLVPYFGDQDINNINKSDVDNFYYHLLDLEVRPGEKYSDYYIRDVLAELKSFLLRYRPTDVPDFPPHASIAKREKQWLGIERQMKIEPYIPEKYRLAIKVLQFTGMRPGELRALQVNDMVDGVLRVWKAFSGNRVRQSRKSGGDVTCHLSLDIWNELLEHVEGKEPNDFIFTLDGVMPLGAGRLYKVWKQACKAAGVKYINIYQASRHSAASEIMEEHKKKALDAIQKKLGHFNQQTAKKHYILS